MRAAIQAELVLVEFVLVLIARKAMKRRPNVRGAVSPDSGRGNSAFLSFLKRYRYQGGLTANRIVLQNCEVRKRNHLSFAVGGFSFGI